MYQPTRENIVVLSTQIEDLDRRIRQGEEAVRNLEDLCLTVAELEQDRRNFLAQLPLESEIANLIDQLRFSASESDVLITNFSQGSGNVDIEDVRAIGFTISSLATFFETMTFLGFLEDLQRFTKINQVSLSAGDGLTANPQLSANYNFIVYVFTGTDPGEPR